MKKAVVYMVAGMSSRFGGRVKQLINVGPNDETLMEISVNQAIKAGFDGIVFIVGQKTESAFKDIFGEEFNGAEVRYAKQTFDPDKRDRPWGTTDALVSAKDVIDCPFVVCSGDDLYGDDAFEKCSAAIDKGEVATVGFDLLSTVPEDGSVNRGLMESADGYITKIVETFDITRDNMEERGIDPHSYASMLMFVLQTDVFEMVIGKLADFKKEHAGDRRIEALLPPDLGDLIKEGKIQMKLYGTTSQWMGVTNPEDEEILREKFAQ